MMRDWIITALLAGFILASVLIVHRATGAPVEFDLSAGTVARLWFLREPALVPGGSVLDLRPDCLAAVIVTRSVQRDPDDVRKVHCARI